MTPHKQRFLHDPANGQWGDCYRTVIACLLDLQPEDVPHYNGAEYDADLTLQDRKMKAWLAERGLGLVAFGLPGDLDEALSMAKGFCSPDQLFMLSGTSPRGACHVVIANSTGMLWDPHPDDTFLRSPWGDDGLWRMEFILMRAVA